MVMRNYATAQLHSKGDTCPYTSTVSYIVMVPHNYQSYSTMQLLNRRLLDFIDPRAKSKK